MTIDWTRFTPISALAGGILIGLAAAAGLILENGRILGASGFIRYRAGCTTPCCPAHARVAVPE
jgi:uncharacterized membrane protein YedE/YeeE